jgi:hypothetical protein
MKTTREPLNVFEYRTKNNMNTIEVTKIGIHDLHKVYKTDFIEKSPSDVFNVLGVEYVGIGFECGFVKVVDDDKFKSACTKYNVNYEMVMLDQDDDYLNSPHIEPYVFEI